MEKLYDRFIREELQDLPMNLTGNDLVRVLEMFLNWLIDNDYLKEGVGDEGVKDKGKGKGKKVKRG